MDISICFIVGIIGNVISLLVFASPIGTFWLIVKQKSTEKYKSLPYISTLLCTSLWTFYGILKPGALLVITVNGAGAILQFIYVILFLIFAPRDKKVRSLIAFTVLNVGFVGAVIAITLLVIHGSMRITFVGVICAVLTIGMYASPLTAMTAVIKTKSVKYMPFFLSLFLFLNAGVWCVYSVLVKDYFIGVPNAVGFVLGSAQLILYTIYKNKPMSTKSMEKVAGLAVAASEESFGHAVIGPTVEMKVTKLVEDEATADHDKVKDRSLAKGKSLPNPKRKLTRQISSLPVLMRTISLGPYDINYSFSRDKDVENYDDDDDVV